MPRVRGHCSRAIPDPAQQPDTMLMNCTQAVMKVPAQCCHGGHRIYQLCVTFCSVHAMPCRPAGSVAV